jgi:hypothetical protein
MLLLEVPIRNQNFTVTRRCKLLDPVQIARFDLEAGLIVISQFESLAADCV